MGKRQRQEVEGHNKTHKDVIYKIKQEVNHQKTQCGQKLRCKLNVIPRLSFLSLMDIFDH